MKPVVPTDTQKFLYENLALLGISQRALDLNGLAQTSVSTVEGYIQSMQIGMGTSQRLCEFTFAFLFAKYSAAEFKKVFSSS